MSESSLPVRILFIDDNPDDRQLVLHEFYAVFPGAQVLEITNADEFETVLATSPPDLVLTDFDLRWTNGPQVLPGCHLQLLPSLER